MGKMDIDSTPAPQPLWKMMVKFIGGIFILLLVISFFMPSVSNECIGRVKIAGEIVYDAPDSLFGGSEMSTATETVKLLKEADGDERVKVVLLEINSPGGSAVASKEIYDEVRAMEKPTLVYMTEMAASGGYYISSGSDYIIAHPNSLTGSIGARGTFLNYEGLFEKLGLREETIKSGELKDIGAGYRNLTDKEREILQAIIDETFGIFRKDVEEGRKGKLDAMLFNEALDARILTASQAKRIGLIDDIGGIQVVMKKANQMAGYEKQTSDPGETLPFCEFGGRRGLDIFGGLSAGIGESIAKGFILGLNERRVSVDYK